MASSRKGKSSLIYKIFCSPYERSLVASFAFMECVLFCVVQSYLASLQKSWTGLSQSMPVSRTCSWLWTPKLSLDMWYLEEAEGIRTPVLVLAFVYLSELFSPFFVWLQGNEDMNTNSTWGLLVTNHLFVSRPDYIITHSVCQMDVCLIM